MSAATTLPQTKNPWVTPLVIAFLVALALFALWLRPYANALAGEHWRSAYARLASGGMIDLGMAGAHWLFWAGITILLQPLILIGGIVLLELALGERKPRADFWAICLFRCSFFICIYIFGAVIARSSGILPRATLAQALEVANPQAQTAVHFGLLLLWLVAWDFVSYWVHRALHRVPILWRIHSVHHCAVNLSAWNNLAHPLESLLMKVSLFPIGYYIGAGGADSATVFLLVGIHSHFVHMDAPLHFGRVNSVLADNRYHFVHHSRERADYNRNFATLFPIWDMMFGTYKAPGERLAQTGINGFLPPHSMRQYLLAQLRADKTRSPNRP